MLSPRSGTTTVTILPSSATMPRLKQPEAGINLRSALKSPGAASSFLHWKKAVANVKVHDMPPDYADKIPTDEERANSSSGSASSSTWPRATRAPS